MVDNIIWLSLQEYLLVAMREVKTFYECVISKLLNKILYLSKKSPPVTRSNNFYEVITSSIMGDIFTFLFGIGWYLLLWFNSTIYCK